MKITIKEEYKLMISQRQVEQNLLWNRHNFYLFANGAMLAGFATIAQSDLSVLKIVIAGIGLISSYFWVGAAKGGLLWIYYYRDLLADTEKKMGAKLKLFCKVKDNYRKFGTQRRLTLSVKGLPWLFLGGWVLLLLWALI